MDPQDTALVTAVLVAGLIAIVAVFAVLRFAGVL